jgi:hypothetical protein
MEDFLTFVGFCLLVWFGIEAMFAHQDYIVGLYIFLGSAAIVTLFHKLRRP